MMKSILLFVGGMFSLLVLTTVGWLVMPKESPAQSVVRASESSAEAATEPIKAGQPIPVPKKQSASTGPPVFAPTPSISSSHVQSWPPSSILVSEVDPKTEELTRTYNERRNEVNELVKKYKTNEDASKNEALRKQIAETTAIQFDLRQQMRELEVEKLRKRLTAVEASVAKRNELKDKIVEKRVADILREPDQLQWDEFPRVAPTPTPKDYIPIAPVPPSYIIPVPQRNARVYPTPTPPVKRNVPQEATESEVIVPIPGTVHVVDEVDVMSRSTNTTVAEAAAKVRIAERKHDFARQQMSKGAVGTQAMKRELDADAELELAKLKLRQVEAEYEGRVKQLELEVRQAKIVIEQSQAEYDEMLKVNEKVPNSIPSAKLLIKRADVELALIRLEQLKVELDSLRNSNQPTAEESTKTNEE
jgi:hypothetical protein